MLVHELVHSGLGNDHGLAVSVVNDLFALTLALGARGFDDLIGLGLGGGALALGKRGGFLSGALALGGQLIIKSGDTLVRALDLLLGLAQLGCGVIVNSR